MGILLLAMGMFAGCGDGEGAGGSDGADGVQSVVVGGSESSNAGAPEGQKPEAPQNPEASQIPPDEETQQFYTHTWQEITITVPVKWREACLFLEQESGLVIYQKASYEKNRSGFVCSFLRETEYFNYGAGETLLAFTDSGVLYYLMRPTDVDCTSEDAAVVKEYVELCGDVDLVCSSVQIAGADVHMNAREYMLPISSISPITRDMILNFSDNDLWIARNEIYARHGREFNNSYLQHYFARCSWYQPTTAVTDFDDSVLSQIERDNIALLQVVEKEYDEKHPYPKQCKSTDAIEADLHGDGTDNTIGYSVEYFKNADAKCYITVDGTTYCASDLVPMWNPREDVFYITDILEWDGVLEIAVLDDGASDDPITYFFRLEEQLTYIGQVDGYPFPEEGSGFNGFNGQGMIEGVGYVNLIETAPIKERWRYDTKKQWIVYHDSGWYECIPARSHELYVDLPVRSERDAESELITIPAQAQVFFLGADNWEWILVKGKDGSMGYMQVKDGVIVELNKPASEVFSDLYFYG